MSLIHKALKKIERKSAPSDFEQIVTPEEELLAKKSGKRGGQFFSASITPRTLALMGIAVIALIYAVYANFFADSGKKTARKSAIVSQPPVIRPDVQSVVPRQAEPTVVGVSRRNEGTTSEGLEPGARALVEEGEKFFLAGDFDNAITKFSEALAVAPESPEVLNSMGLALKKKGDAGAAERYYRQALKKDPRCSECLNNLAVVEADKGDSVSAVLNLKKSISISETYADPYFNLAVIMEKEGNYKSAVDNYKSFLTYTSSEDSDLKQKIKTRIEDLVLNWEE